MSDTKYIQVMRKFIGCLFLIQMYCVCVWGQTPGMEMVETNIRESYLWKLNGHPCLKQKIKHCVNGPASPDIMIRELKEGVDLKAVKRYFQAMQENGSWPDLNYRDDSRSGWQPSFHAERLALLAKAYRYPGGKYFHDKRLSDAIHRGMNYWFEGRFRCPNWWYNQIGVPKMMGCVFLLMVSEMSEAEKTEAIRYMENARLGMTGQNSVWLAENVLVRALLIQDENLFLQARNAILKELKVNETGEGIRPDMSFHQHGAQLQFGNYGLAFANTAVYWARIFHGTEYALTTDQLKILNNYLLEGMQWIVWGGYMDISSCGRQLFWNAQQGKALSLGKALQNMMVADEGNREIYRRFYEEHILGVQDGNSFCGDMYFPYSDFGVHRTSSWSGTVKMSSKRVIGSEIVNAENLSGCYLGDGALYVYQQGNEYRDIFPVWDWTKLPGVTCCEDKEVFGKGYTFSNQHDFVGGVSDGSKSVLAMVQHKNGVKARKSYFFTGNTIVCVGTDIQYAGVYCVTTGVEQNLLQGKVREWKGEKGAQAYYHQGCVYFFNGEQQVHCTAGKQAGSWRRVARFADTAVVEKDVFALWIEHGKNPSDASYCYTVVPGVKEKEWKAVVGRLQEKVVIRDKHIHGIYADSTWMMVFFAPGEMKLDEIRNVNLKSDGSCIAMWKATVLGGVLVVAEPTGGKECLKFRLTGNWRGDGCIYHSEENETLVSVPVGDTDGRSVEVGLEKL